MSRPRQHYKTLGVPPDAKPEQIKRAYRSKAKKAHPDKGGSAKEMEELSRAYACLSDPQRRLTYDAGGSDQPRCDERTELNINLALIFEIIISQYEDRFVERARQLAESKWFEAKRALSAAEGNRAKLVKKRDRVRRKGEGTNIFENIMDLKITGADLTIAHLEREIELIGKVKVALQDYDDVLSIDPVTEPKINDRRRWHPVSPW